jgi:hypothetical protein
MLRNLAQDIIEIVALGIFVISIAFLYLAIN